jgi:hypothetical protein
MLASKKAGKYHTCDLSEESQRNNNANEAVRILFWMCCRRELSFDTDVGKASVRSKGQLCQALYPADVTRRQLPFEAVDVLRAQT